MAKPGVKKGQKINRKTNGHMHGNYVRLSFKGMRIFEHRYVWEKENGPIPDGYSIHHINGNQTDNRIENLELLPIGEHVRMHKKGKPLPAHVHAAKVAATKGKPLSEEHKRKVNLGLMGRIVSMETRKKISNSLIGHSVSEETRRKISETKKRRNAYG